MMNNVIEFRTMIKNFSLEELQSEKESLLKNLAIMVADPTLGAKLTAIEQEINNREQVKK